MLDPNYPAPYFQLGAINEEFGRIPEAEAAYLRAEELAGCDAATLKTLDATFRKSGIDAFERARTLRRLARLEARARTGRVSPKALAVQYAALGDKDRASRFSRKPSASAAQPSSG